MAIEFNDASAIVILRRMMDITKPGNSTKGISELPEVILSRGMHGEVCPKIAVAESCTGGYISHRITNVPGSSGYFVGGVVTYANSAKQSLLGVPVEIIETHGAVSAECAAAMSEGMKRVLGSEIAISTTGIAGPDGGTDSKPVGLVYFGLSSDRGTAIERMIFDGSRFEIIESASDHALKMLVKEMDGYLRRNKGESIQ